MSAILVSKITKHQKTENQIPDVCKQTGRWSVWSCPPSQFDWHYDAKEIAYIFEGKVIVTTAQEKVELSAGDYVVFPEGLDCHWQVLETIRKVYRFE